MAGSVSLLTVQFLRWIAARPRTHAEVRDAWQSTCPLNSAWEDAMSDDLVQFDSGSAASKDTRILLTARGRTVLESAEKSDRDRVRA
jgi:hypothetical protein